MSVLTINKIMENEDIILKYKDFTLYLESEIKKNHGKYYIHDMFEIELDKEITIEMMDETLKMYDNYISQKTVIPFTKKPDFTNIMEIKKNYKILREIITNYNIEDVHCCNYLCPNKDSMDESNKDSMDESNKKMMKIWNTQGVDAMIMDEMNEKKMSYGEMRALYG